MEKIVSDTLANAQVFWAFAAAFAGIVFGLMGCVAGVINSYYLFENHRRKMRINAHFVAYYRDPLGERPGFRRTFNSWKPEVCEFAICVQNLCNLDLTVDSISFVVSPRKKGKIVLVAPIPDKGSVLPARVRARDSATFVYSKKYFESLKEAQYIEIKTACGYVFKDKKTIRDKISQIPL